MKKMNAKVKAKKAGTSKKHHSMTHRIARDKGLRKNYFSKSSMIIFGLLFALIGGYMVFQSSAASTATVTVTNTSSGSVQTQLSTNIVPYYPLNSVAGAQTKFNNLHPPYVRLHIGDDSTAMPEIRQNQWANSGESRAFESLDELVSEVYAANQEVLMNIKFAPPWQWTCSTHGATGTVRDLTFQEYAAYMARLVDYYNHGSMVTETGTTITNPSGTSHRITYWELWNEPDLNNETPCAPASGFGITYQQYSTMWNAVTAAMLAKDSTLKFVGPATAGGQFGSGGSGNQYADYLMAHATTIPTALSFHGYGYWDNTVSDHWVFDGDGSCGDCGGVSSVANSVNSLHTLYPNIPIWLTEVNVNADWGNDSHKRPISEFSAAWWGSMFAQTAPMNAGIIHQYDVLDDIQFGLINVNNGNTFTPYHVFGLLNQYFPQGSTLLSSSSDTSNILSLAVRTPGGHTSVLVVNRQLANNTVASNCGVGGVPVTVTVNLASTPSAVTLRQIDKNNVNCSTNTATAATSTAQPASATQTITFPGYGIAVLDITPSGGGDTQPPVISNVSSTGVTSSGATINWTTDEASDSQVEYGTTTSYGSSTTLNSNLVTSHSQALSGLSAGTLYHYRVKSKDAAGNLATGSDFTFTTTAVDTTPPTVSMTAPANGATVSGSSTTVSATASDNVGVVGVQFKLDGANLQAEDASSPYQITWDTTTASNGSHTLTATVRDAAGNTTTATSISVTVSNTCPNGDVNSDCHVTITDLSIMLSYWGSTTNATCDLNHNGTVDIFDLSVLLSNYGR